MRPTKPRSAGLFCEDVNSRTGARQKASHFGRLIGALIDLLWLVRPQRRNSIPKYRLIILLDELFDVIGVNHIFLPIAARPHSWVSVANTKRFSAVLMI